MRLFHLRIEIQREEVAVVVVRKGDNLKQIVQLSALNLSVSAGLTLLLRPYINSCRKKKVFFYTLHELILYGLVIMRKISIALALVALGLVACGENDNAIKGFVPAEVSDIVTTTFDDLPVCTAKREGAIAYVKDQKTVYVCVDSMWFATKDSVYLDNGDFDGDAKDYEKDTLGWANEYKNAKDGDVHNGRVNSNQPYVYQNKSWRMGTEMDSLLYKVGGRGCITDGDTSKVKYKDEYYVCTAQSSDSVSSKWVKAPDIYNDTYESRKECFASGTYGDGAILTGRVNTDKKYVCDAGEFRVADSTEISGGKGCTSYNQEELYILKNQYSYYKCGESGWNFTLEKLNQGTVKYGGQTYKTIGIKTQNWMAENLNYEVEGQSYCFKNSADSCAKYGRLYTWAAAVGKSEEECGYGKICNFAGNIRGVCPEGWHLPSRDEWDTLYSAIGCNYSAMQAKGFANWPDATDAYGFSALPVGYYENGYFPEVGKRAYFWSATEVNIYYANNWTLGADFTSLSGGFHKIYGCSIRCVMD